MPGRQETKAGRPPCTGLCCSAGSERQEQPGGSGGIQGGFASKLEGTTRMRRAVASASSRLWLRCSAPHPPAVGEGASGTTVHGRRGKPVTQESEAPAVWKLTQGSRKNERRLRKSHTTSRIP
jgi:hypothetical protein